MTCAPALLARAEWSSGGQRGQVGTTNPFHIWKKMRLHYNISSESVHNTVTQGKVTIAGRVQAKVGSETDKRQGDPGPRLF